ncbi:MAG: hypothetical protein ACREL2_11140 [Gemmatimonadales bacterium]
MTGYSDRAVHALAFAAKQLARDGARPAAALARPANLAIILTSYGCEEVTVVAAVLHELILQTSAEERPALTRRLGEKFGPVTLAVVGDALPPDAPGRSSLRRTWETECVDRLAHLVAVEPRTLSILAAQEILDCGTILSDVRRLGPEYLPASQVATGAQLVWWFRSVAETLDRQEAWPRREMLGELRLLTGTLAEELGI